MVRYIYNDNNNWIDTVNIAFPEDIRGHPLVYQQIKEEL